MALGTNHMTVTTGAAFIPEVWSKDIQRATESNLVFSRLVKRFDSDVLTKGGSISVPKVSNLSANAKSASTQVLFQSPTENSVTITINKHYEASIIIEDILNAQSAYWIQDEYKQKMGYALAKQVDTDVSGLYTNITQTVGTSGSAPSDDDFLRAIQYLDDADAPTQDRSFVMAPKVKAAYLGIDKYVNQDFTGMGDIPVKTGLFGQRYGNTFYVSTNVPTSGGNPINIFFQKEVFALALQKNITLKTDYIIEYLGQAYVAQALYGVASYRPTFGVQVLS